MTSVKFNDFLSEQIKKRQEWTTVREKVVIIIGIYNKIRSTRRLSKNPACPLLSLCLFGLWRFQHQLYRCIKHTLHILQFSVAKFQFMVLGTNLEQCFTMSKVCYKKHIWMPINTISLLFSVSTILHRLLCLEQ